MTTAKGSFYTTLVSGVLATFGALGCADAASNMQPNTGSVTQAETPGCAALTLPSQNSAAVFELGQHIEAGQELEVCALQQVGPEDIWLNSTDMMLSKGSHHGLLWLTDYDELPELDRSGDPIEIGKVVRCESAAFGRFSVIRPLAGSQGTGNITAPGVLPPDVAERIPANAYVVTNLHMLNSMDRAIDACMKVAVNAIPEHRVAQEAGVLFFYNPFIALAGHSTGQARMACAVTADIHLRTAVSHMHARGVGYRASWLDASPFADGTHTLQTLYETTEWDSPADKVWPEPLPLRAGNFIDYTCDYENAEARDVAQGFATSDEMCMFSGAYWPYEPSLTFCGTNTQGYTIGSGDHDGSTFMNCMLTNLQQPGATEACGSDGCTDYAARVAFQSCFRDACPAVGEYASGYLNCVKQNAGDCRSRCGGGTASDTGCLLNCLNHEKCPDVSASLAATQCH